MSQLGFIAIVEIVLPLFLFLRTTSSNQPYCRIRCGVIREMEGLPSFQVFVRSVFTDLKQQESTINIDITFEQIEPRWGQTMSELLDAYVNIGSTNASVVLGPYMQLIAKATERHSIPYFVTSDVKAGEYQPYNTITIFPSLSNVYSIALDVIDLYRWTEIAVFYEDMEGLYLLEKLMQQSEVHVRTWKIEGAPSVQDIRHFLLEIRQHYVTNLLLLTSQVNTPAILAEGLKLSMMSNKHSWLIPSSVTEADLLPYAYTQTNLTTFRLAAGGAGGPGVSRTLGERQYDSVYDSLLTLYHAVATHRRYTRDCLWTGRENILRVLSKISVQGSTGLISFSSDGARTGYQVDIMGLRETGLQQIGVWNSSRDSGSLSMSSRARPAELEEREFPLGSGLVSVVTILEDPFVRLKTDDPGATGNDRLEGFCVDLLDKIAKTLGFNYNLYLVPDGQYGEKQPGGSWNGLIGELASGNASLVVAALSITSSRESVIDFTKPFKADGISIVMRRPTQKSSFFQFTEPLSGIVWLLMLAVLVSTSVGLYLLDRVCPPGEDGGRFCIQESFWFTFASMMLSGTEIHPRTVAGRCLAGALWLFSLIIISTYTANLAAFLTVTKFDSDIKSIFDLLDQSKVKYGTVNNSDVGAFFQNNRISRFQQLWQMMSEVDPDSMVETSAEGFERARTEEANYAFIWDSPAVRFQVEHDCNLMEIGEPLGSRAYGIGVPLGAQYRDDISMAILQMAESGEITALEHKWWTSPIKCPDVEKAKPSKTRSLSVDNVGGVFIILVLGMVLALVAAAFDYLIRSRTARSAKNRRSVEKSCDKNHLDGAIPASLQVEEPFLTYNTRADSNGRHGSKQTNIF